MTYLRKHLLRRTSAPFLLLSLGFIGAYSVEAFAKPNIVVFLVDDLGIWISVPTIRIVSMRPLISMLWLNPVCVSRMDMPPTLFVLRRATA